MATLSVTNSFIAGTLAKSSEVNQNFTDLVNWAAGNIQNDNFGTMTGQVTWAITTGVKAISIGNSGNEGSIDITQSAVLNPNKSAFKLTDNAAQVSGDASAYFNMSSLSSTIPVVRMDYAGSQVFAAKKDRLEIPSRTTVQRDAISGPSASSILYNSTTQTVDYRNGSTWASLAGPDDNTLEIVGGILQVADFGIANAQLANNAVTESKIISNAVTTNKIANSNITAAKIESSVNLPGTNVKANSRSVVVSGSASASTNMQICIADINGNGTANYTEGILGYGRASLGRYNISFTNAFSINPIIQVTPEFPAVGVVHGIIYSKNGLSCVIEIRDSGGAVIDSQFSFLAIGPR